MDAKTMTKAAVANVVSGREVAITKKDKDQFRSLLEERLPELAEASLAKLPPEYIVSTVMSALRATPKLRECYAPTVLHGVLQATQFGLKLDPVAGEAYLIPRWNGKTQRTEANFQPGYRGLLKLVRRNKLIRDVAAQPVRANDEFSFSYGSSPSLIHRFDPKASLKDRGDVVGYYACANFTNGGFQFEYWDHERMIEHGKAYGGKKKGSLEGTWKDNFDEMARKTMILRLIPLLPGDDPMLSNVAELDYIDHTGGAQELQLEDGKLVHAPISVEEPAKEPEKVDEKQVELEENIVAVEAEKEADDATKVARAELVLTITKAIHDATDCDRTSAIRKRLSPLYKEKKLTDEDVMQLSKALNDQETMLRAPLLAKSKAPGEPLYPEGQPKEEAAPVPEKEKKPRKPKKEPEPSLAQDDAVTRFANEIDKAEKFTQLALLRSRIEKAPEITTDQKQALLKKLIQKHNEKAKA